ncbi:MAG: hypothetical protein ACE361_20185 [Aureliella sp.]
MDSLFGTEAFNLAYCCSMAEEYNEFERALELYLQGYCTPVEALIRITESLATQEADEQILRDLLARFPDDLLSQTTESLHDLAEMDFYRRTTYLEDPRTPEERHADALRLQPLLRKLNRVMVPCVLRELIKRENGAK